DVIGRVLHAVQRDLANRNKTSDVADFAFQATRVGAGYAGFDHRTLGNVGPAAGDDCAPGNRDLVETVLGVVACDGDIDHVARLRRLRKIPHAGDSLILAAE